MSLKCGIVGLPNVGKSTIFNVLTRAKAQAQNYAFCTIEPNVAHSLVPDKRFDMLVQQFSPKNSVQNIMEFVDIAGLVAGASKGEGLGNQFLGNIRNTQAIVHVLRCFEDDNVMHVSSRVDPKADKETIETELMLADLSSLEKQLQKLQKQASAHPKDTALQQTLELGLRLQSSLEKGEYLLGLLLEEEEKLIAKQFNLITLLPIIYVCNVDEDSILDQNEYSKKIKSWGKETGFTVLSICGKIEAELAELSLEEQEEYIKELGLKERSINKMIRESFSLLNLITFFTAGPEEVRAWTVKKGITAAQAAGCIHSDMQRGFICAEVLSFNDFAEYLDMKKAAEKGLMRLEGKDYIVEDGDILHIRFNV